MSSRTYNCSIHDAGMFPDLNYPASVDRWHSFIENIEARVIAPSTVRCVGVGFLGFCAMRMQSEDTVNARHLLATAAEQLGYVPRSLRDRLAELDKCEALASNPKRARVIESNAIERSIMDLLQRGPEYRHFLRECFPEVDTVHFASIVDAMISNKSVWENGVTLNRYDELTKNAAKGVR